MTPTSKILRKWQYEKNPVTKAVYREIIGNRIDQASGLAFRNMKRINSLEKAIL